MLTDDMKRVVREQGLCFVATVCPDGTPNLSPKGTTAVWDDDHLVYVDLASPAYGQGLSRAEIVDRSLCRLERVYDLQIEPAMSTGES